MSPDRIRLEGCASCGTAFPATEAQCPECGAVRAGRVPAPPAPPGGAPPPGMEDLFSAFGPMMGGAAPSRRQALGSMARLFLGRNVGCLVWILAIFFGIPLAVGAMAGDALGGLAVMLLVVGIAGLALTGWLVWLVKPRRPRP